MAPYRFAIAARRSASARPTTKFGPPISGNQSTVIGSNASRWMSMMKLRLIPCAATPPPIPRSRALPESSTPCVQMSSPTLPVHGFRHCAVASCCKRRRCGALAQERWAARRKGNDSLRNRHDEGGSPHLAFVGDVEEVTKALSFLRAVPTVVVDRHRLLKVAVDKREKGDPVAIMADNLLDLKSLWSVKSPAPSRAVSSLPRA